MAETPGSRTARIAAEVGAFVSVSVTLGDCMAVLAARDGPLFDCCVTDPPYHLTSIVKRFGKADSAPCKEGATGAYARTTRGFMGKEWDGGDIAFRPELWRAVYDQMKPGAHLIAFSGTRTYHRMACAIEDAGFEIRDQLQWIYGSGFPKSHDVSKGIDRAAGAEREVVGSKLGRPGMAKDGSNQRNANAAFGAEITRILSSDITAPATDEARQWQGWGTALKPAWESVCLAQKPFAIQQEWVTIRADIERLWSLLWLTLPANIAAQCFTPSPSDYGVDPSAFAQCHAALSFNIRDGLPGLTDTSQFVSALLSSLNTVSSWNATLAESCKAASTSTISMGSSATTDLRTLRFSLSQITPASIILAHKSGQWLNADACNAGRLLSATVALSAATLTLSAVESATDWAAINCPDAGEFLPNGQPICLARKPLSEKSIAANVLKHGTGGLNIDACRIGIDDQERGIVDSRSGAGFGSIQCEHAGRDAGETFKSHALGRWPANILHDGSDEVLAGFPETVDGVAIRAKGGNNIFSDEAKPPLSDMGYGGGGSAARFFYSAPQDIPCGLCGMPCSMSAWNVSTAETHSPTVATQSGNTADEAAPVPPQPANGGKKNGTKRPARNAASSSGPCPLPTASIAAESAPAQLPESLVQNVKSAGSLCASCATAIAQNLAAYQQGQDPGSLQFPASISDHSAQILRQNLALYVAGRESTDTILTTASLKQLFGSVFLAIAENTQANAKPESLESPERSSRFWYSGKAQKLDRIGSSHPTVKPVDVMRWLVRLVTPPGGLILDPFAGSGTTGIAAMAEGFDCELIDLMPDHVADIERKLSFLRGEGRLTVQEHINGREARKDAGASALPILDWLAA